MNATTLPPLAASAGPHEQAAYVAALQAETGKQIAYLYPDNGFLVPSFIEAGDVLLRQKREASRPTKAASSLVPFTRMDTVTAALQAIGARLTGTSPSGSCYFEAPGGMRIRVSDHAPNDATQRWIDNREVASIRIDQPDWQEQLQAITGCPTAPVDPPSPAEPDNFQSMLKEFVALEKERREHEDRLDVIQARLAQLQEPLQEYFADTGMQNTRVDGLTVYVKVDRYVSKRSGIETSAVCRALEECGLGYMVTDGYNAQSLKSKIKEYQEAGIEVPEILRDLLNIGEQVKLATRK